MRKVSILKRKILKAYKNDSNWDYSNMKGYPSHTYFGYANLNELINSSIKEFREFYGNSLRKWRYIW